MRQLIGDEHIFIHDLSAQWDSLRYSEEGVGVEAGFCNRGGVFKVDNEWMCGCCSRNAEKEGV